MKKELVGMAEQAVRKRAEEIAYEKSEGLSSHEMQKLFYSLYKEVIILGARIFIEEYERLEEHEDLYIAMAGIDAIKHELAERNRTVNA